jgi:hypothetical protein
MVVKPYQVQQAVERENPQFGIDRMTVLARLTRGDAFRDGDVA